MRRRWRLWAVAAPLWLIVCVTVVVPYVASPSVWLLGGLALATLALVPRRTRWLALAAPAAGVLGRSSDPSVPSQVIGVAGLLAAAVVVALLDGWDLSAPGRAQAAMVRSDGDGQWVRECLLALLPAISTTLAVAVGWIVLSSLRWPVGPWWVALTPALLATAVAAATYELWRPRRDSNPRPPP